MPASTNFNRESPKLDTDDDAQDLVRSPVSLWSRCRRPPTCPCRTGTCPQTSMGTSTPRAARRGRRGSTSRVTGNQETLTAGSARLGQGALPLPILLRLCQPLRMPHDHSSGPACWPRPGPGLAHPLVFRNPTFFNHSESSSPLGMGPPVDEDPKPGIAPLCLGSQGGPPHPTGDPPVHHQVLCEVALRSPESPPPRTPRGRGGRFL